MADGHNTNAILGVLKSLAPVLGGALGSALGPAGTAGGAAVAGAAVTFLADKLGVQEKTADAVMAKVASMPTDELTVKLKELEYNFKKYCSDNDIKLDLAQISVNLEESKSSSLFVAGWRPCMGWICDLGIGYHFLIRPLLNGVCYLILNAPDPFPALEIQDLIALITGMLGQSYLRSQDKKNKTAT